MDRSSENAVSPVIGVILMVAVSVILAAVIASFVLGMTTNIPVTHTVAVTADAPDPDHIILIYKGGPDAASFSYGTVTITPGVTGTITWANTTPKGAPPAEQYILGGNVGSMVIATANTARGFTGKDHVIVTGRFKDGSSQVILNTFI